MTQQWDETPERDMTEKDYGDECLMQREKENDEKDVLMVDLFSSKFAGEVEE